MFILRKICGPNWSNKLVKNLLQVQIRAQKADIRKKSFKSRISVLKFEDTLGMKVTKTYSP